MGYISTRSPKRYARNHFHVLFTDSKGHADLADAQYPTDPAVVWRNVTPRYESLARAQAAACRISAPGHWSDSRTFTADAPEPSAIDIAHIIGCNRDCIR